MGSDHRKVNINIYFGARKKAALCDSRLQSREGASELLGISVSTLADYELGNTKVVPVDKVVLMADLYHAPELIPNYCMNECPVHGFLPMETKDVAIESTVIHVLKEFDVEELERMKKDLINIIADCEVSDSEKRDLDRIMMKLESIAKVISEMKISCEKLFE